MTRANRRLFEKRSDVVSLAVVAAHVGFVLAPVFIAAMTPPGLHLVLLWLWLGLSMQGLLNLLHECAHGHVFRAPENSDMLADWLLAPLMVASFDGYRALHWKHHWNLGGDEDPRYSYRVDFRGWKFASFFIRCVTLVEAVRKFLYQAGSARDSAPSYAWLPRAALVHSLFLACLVLAASAKASEFETACWRAAIAYVFVYAYGVASLSIFAATLRAIAEHQDDGRSEVTEGRASLRNLRSNPITFAVFACHGFADHATRHLEPGIPAYNLGRATARPAVEEPRLAPKFGYADLL